MLKDRRVTKELKRLSAPFASVSDAQRTVIDPLIQNAAFMKVTLEDLQTEIAAEGLIDEYMNGLNQCGKKQSATLQAYNSLVKNYSTVVKMLNNLLPKEIQASRLSGFMDDDE